MGNQKLKWTEDEELALLAGVEKHNPGKWKNILRDPEFADRLGNRSNIDLKDKWRNISVAPGIQGSKDKVRTPQIKAAAFHLASAAAATTTSATPTSNSSLVAPLLRSGSSDLSVDDSCTTVGEGKNVPRYDGMIFEALSALADANGPGSDVGAILNFIEQKHEVPPKFRRILSSRLRRLAGQERIEKTENFYKLNDNRLGTRTPQVARPKENTVKLRQTNSQVVPQEMVGEASITAAYKLVEVENKIDVVKAAVEEVEKMTKLAERAEDILQLAKELHEECCQGKIVELY